MSTTQPLRVLSLVSELNFGGDENRLLSLARTIDRSRFAHTIVTIKRPNDAVDSYYGSMRGIYEDHGVSVMHLDEGHANHGVSLQRFDRHVRASAIFARALARVIRLVRRQRVDVIDAHGGPGQIVGVTASRVTGVPAVLTTYDVEQWEPYWLWRVIHPSTLRAARAVMTDSDMVASAVRKLMRRTDRLVDVIPNGALLTPCSRTSAQMRAIFELPDDPDARVVGQIASFFPSKGQFVLLEAAAAVLQRHPRTYFAFVGFVRRDPHYREKLFARARELGIADHVRVVSYAGPISDVWQIVDVHAHPTLLDSLPHAIIEGMSQAKPAVVSALGGIPGLVVDGVTGLLVPPGDVAELVRGLDRVLSDAALAGRLGEAARERFERGYTAEIMTRRIERVFERAARTRTGR